MTFPRTIQLLSAAALLAGGLLAQDPKPGAGSGTVRFIAVEEGKAPASALAANKKTETKKAEATTLSGIEAVHDQEDGEILVATIDASGKVTMQCVHGDVAAKKIVEATPKARLSKTVTKEKSDVQ